MKSPAHVEVPCALGNHDPLRQSCVFGSSDMETTKFVSYLESRSYELRRRRGKGRRRRGILLDVRVRSYAPCSCVAGVFKCHFVLYILGIRYLEFRHSNDVISRHYHRFSQILLSVQFPIYYTPESLSADVARIAKRVQEVEIQHSFTAKTPRPLPSNVCMYL